MASTGRDGQSPRRNVIVVVDSDDDNAGMAPLDDLKTTATAAQAPVQPTHSAVPAAAAQQEAASAMVSVRRANDSAICSMFSSGSSDGAPAGTGSDGHRQPLTEAEKKEEQRLRRVIANRESARKTSLRRKALFADLEKKVAELTTENENLKKEKDVWTEKYRTLLKKQQQEAKMTQKAPQVAVAMNAAGASRPLPSLNCAMPPVPFTWPPLQVSTAAEEGHRSLLPLLSQDTTMQAAPLPTQEPWTSGGGEDDDRCSLSLAVNAASDDN